MNAPVEVTFVTSSQFKREETAVFQASCRLSDGRLVSDAFKFALVENTIQETLQVELEAIVSSEVREAYRQLKRPCIVEHAGLIFSDYEEQGYPGGLTKPMWNTLGDSFLQETHSQGRAVTARAVIGYCDGQRARTFVGSTLGKLSEAPRGDRKFYWDTIFIPSEDNDDALTYAEIVERDGLEYKMLKHSQSAKAMIAFLDWRIHNAPRLWDVVF